MANEHGIEGGSDQHADYCQPYFCRALGRKSSKADAEHV